MASHQAQGRIMVEPGDTTYTIARDYAGDGARFPELVRANPRKVTTVSGMFESLTPGETLTLPMTWGTRRAPAGSSLGAPDDAKGIDDAGALPYGWTNTDVQIVVELADAWDMDPEDLMAVWFSESGLQPHLERPNIGPGYYGLNMGWDQAMTGTAGWKPGTWISIVRNESVAVQLQALAKFYDAQAKQMLGESFASRAQKLGVTPAAVLYAMNFVPAWASRMRTADQPMVRNAPYSDFGIATGSARTDLNALCALKSFAAQEACFYKSNPGFDVTSKGYISMRDMDLRISRMRSNALASKNIAPLLLAARDKSDDPSMGLAKLFAPSSNAYAQATGQNPYIPASMTSGGGGGSILEDLVLAAGAAFVVWKVWKG
jgi:hypothetical protein